jgi:hypothetical protein
MCRISYVALCLELIHVMRHRTLPHPPQNMLEDWQHTVLLCWAYMWPHILCCAVLGVNARDGGMLRPRTLSHLPQGNAVNQV